MSGGYRDNARESDVTLPRILWEGPLYPSHSPNDPGADHRVRVVLTRAKDGGNQKIVEMLMSWGTMGEPCWIPVPGGYQGTVITALTEAFR